MLPWTRIIGINRCEAMNSDSSTLPVTLFHSVDLIYSGAGLHQGSHGNAASYENAMERLRTDRI